MSYLIKPAGYKALLNLSQTEMGIKKIKDFFQQNLSSELRLRRVTAPLFVLKGMGINDDLNGTERAVTFPIKDLNDSKAEIVHSLAKWKRNCHALWSFFPESSSLMSSCNGVVLQPHPCRNMDGLGCSPFARHYWGNHCLFSFPAGTKMFQFPALASNNVG